MRPGPGPAPLPRVPVDRDALAASRLRLPTAADTQALGAALAGYLRAGDLVVLTGPLGAGKTALTQGIGAGLGVRGTVASPTFVIARVHPAGDGVGPALVHVDVYRLGSLAELDDLDLDADLPSSVVVVEWGAGLAERLAESWLSVTMEPDPRTEARTALLEPHGGDWAERLGRLTANPPEGVTAVR